MHTYTKHHTRSSTQSQIGNVFVYRDITVKGLVLKSFAGMGKICLDDDRSGDGDPSAVFFCL